MHPSIIYIWVDILIVFDSSHEAFKVKTRKSVDTSWKMRWLNLEELMTTYWTCGMSSISGLTWAYEKVYSSLVLSLRRARCLVLHCCIIVSSPWPTVWPNYVCDVAVPRGFALPHWRKETRGVNSACLAAERSYTASRSREIQNSSTKHWDATEFYGVEGLEV